MRPKLVLGGLISEAWARSSTSYVRSMEYYNARVRNGIQPRTPFINLFHVQQQNTVLVVANLIYLLVTMGLFIYMKKRKTGLRLRWPLVIYDAINVIVAAYIAISTINYKLGHGGLLLCNPISNDPEGYRIANIFVLFYLQKYFEFIDTWFFVLRKSSRQVTFLHLFHHSSITIVVGTILPFDYNGDMYLPILLNSANHMLVYLHYLLASLGIQAWWAKYITSMQLGQFCLIFGQSLLSYRVGPTCGSPDFAKVLMTCYMGSLIALFGNFFLQKYIFRMPGSTVNMCGVIKQPATEVNLTSEHCGVIELNNYGVGIVYLNKTQHATFPDLSFLQKTAFSSVSTTTSNNSNSNLSHSQSPSATPREATAAAAVATGYYPSFQVVYQLTAIGSAMPNLHIKKEICRYTGNNNNNNNNNSSSSSSSSNNLTTVPLNSKYVANTTTSSTSTANSNNSNSNGNLIHSQSSNNIPFPPRDNNNNNNNNNTDVIRSSRYSTTSSNASNDNLRHSGLSSSGNGTAIYHHQQPRSRSNSSAVTAGVTANNNNNSNNGSSHGTGGSTISRASSTSSTNLPNLMNNNIHSSSVASTTTAAGDDEEIDITHSTNSKPSTNKKKKKNTSPGISTNNFNNNSTNNTNNSNNNSTSTTPVANISVSAALMPSPSSDEWWVSSSALTEQFLAAASTTNSSTRNNFPSTTTSAFTGPGIVSNSFGGGSGLNMMPRSVSTGSLMPNSFNTITKSKSHDQLMYLQHNDRLIDGPLPLESLVETYRRQFSSSSSTTNTTAMDSTVVVGGNGNGSNGNSTTLMSAGRSLDSIYEHDLNHSSHSTTASMSATAADGSNNSNQVSNGNGSNSNNINTIASTYSTTLASNTSRNSLSSSGSTSGSNLITIDSSSHSNLDYSINNKNTATTAATINSSHIQQTQSHSLQQTLQQSQAPICFFTVAGGVAGGKVSWTVKTVPVSIKPASGSGSGGVTFLQGDWRSIT